MSAQENKERFRRFMDEGPNRGNLAIVDELFAPDVAFYIPGSAEPVRGIDGVKGIVAGFRAAFPDLQVTIDEMIAEGEMVAARATARGTNTGELMGTAPTGKHAAWVANHDCRFANGKIIEDRVNYDQLAFLQQLGMMPGNHS
jgi:predicted ester cyclase